MVRDGRFWLAARPSRFLQPLLTESFQIVMSFGRIAVGYTKPFRGAAWPTTRMLLAARFFLDRLPSGSHSTMDLSFGIHQAALWGCGRALGRIRTGTVRPLRPLPLPLGHEGRKLGTEDSNLH